MEFDRASQMMYRTWPTWSSFLSNSLIFNNKLSSLPLEDQLATAPRFGFEPPAMARIAKARRPCAPARANTMSNHVQFRIHPQGSV
jgi:hypothetical protein